MRHRLPGLREGSLDPLQRWRLRLLAEEEEEEEAPPQTPPLIAS
jgi:hypothetical protein